MKLTNKIRSLVLLAIFALFAGGNAYGAFYFTPANAQVPKDGSVAATADVTLGDGFITVVLTDTLANPISSGQTLSGLKFDVSGATGAASLASALGYTALINSDNKSANYGSYTPSVNAVSLAHWGANNDVNLSTVGLGGAKPYDLIIGPDSAGGFTGAGKYSNANTGFDQFNPYVLGSATFIVHVPGVTENSVLSNVLFEFGTDPQYVAADLTVVPEPSTVLAGMLLLLPFGVSTVKSLRRNRVE